MRGIRRATALVALLSTCIVGSLRAQERQELRVSRVSQPPTIDGVLDDQAWAGAPLGLGAWISYNPLRGDSAPERTEIRVSYDDRFVYFAFTCLSDDPASIRTTISRRDTVFSDDWVGLSLDSTGTGQSAYHLMVNPSGIQMDAINTTAAGERFESDFLWYSAGQRTAGGYAVEVALPVESIRFSSGPDVTMGILFWRHVSRAGMSYSWPDLPPGQWVFDRHARLVFPDLEPRRLIELLPSATLPLSQTRATQGRWHDVEGKPDLGLSVKVGVTPQVTVDATVNPDFSQVESDAFQVQVNQRFPTFFSEKRPFFMEGMGLFSVAGTGGDFNMRSAVHTRRIVDPTWGAKLIGTAGRLSFGLLEASDATPQGFGLTGGALDDPDKLFSIGRATYSLGGSDYVGAIATETRHGGRSNRVVGGDLSWKPTPAQNLSAMYLWSQIASAADSAGGAAAQLSYRYDTRRWLVAPHVEHYDRSFEMDTAFYNRTGFSSAFVYSEVNFYPEAAKRIGLIRVHPLVVARYGEDHLQGGTEAFIFGGVAFNFTRQGFLRIQRGVGHEHFAGQRFRTGEPFAAFGGTQLFRWLRVGGHFFPSGWAPYYDPAQPYQGRSTTGGLDLDWQPNEHFNQGASFNRVRFRRADTGLQVYAVDIVNLKTVYQFDRHLLARLIAQFDSSRRQWLTDLLLSYEFVPGTALYAGYGALYERPPVETSRPAADRSDYMAVRRGLFFKASYLYRF